ncbi:MAG TPA: glycosyltransferase family 2 protein [Nocardioidaceae bacterium]|jgi:hypothetical protein|nr:glycosyltransferase family 2 protein [Nocardioidaceae bacterium]
MRLFRPTRDGARQAAKADRRPVSDVAVFTMARDEAAMLPRWVDYYAAQVGVDNLVVLDDNSVDGSTDKLPCTVHRLPRLPGKEQYEYARMSLISGISAGLLAAYDTVIFVDVDEFLVPDPSRYAGLVDFLKDREDRDAIAPMTLNVLHVPDREGPIDPDKPVLGQRRFAKFVPVMCKPSIKRVPANWRGACHGIMAPFEVDRGLFMLHLKFYDKDALVKVSDHRRALVDADGRAYRSNWAVGGAEMGASLASFIGDTDLDTVPEFDPATVDLGGIVKRRDHGGYRATGAAQVKAMHQQPLRRIPERLHGIV